MEVVDKLGEFFKTQGLNLDKESEDFAHIFSEIGNAVSAAELKRNRNVSDEYIDDKVFKEVSKYMLKNKELMFNKKIFKTKEIKTVSTPPPVLKKMWIPLSSGFGEEITSVDINLDVLEIKTIELSYTSHDYNITDNNNTLVFVEKAQYDKELYTDEKRIVLENGKYNVESLIQELKFKFSQQNLHHKYFFHTDEITKKIAISTIDINDNISHKISVLRCLKQETPLMFKILWDKSNVSKTLGYDRIINEENCTFISDYPLDLYKDAPQSFITLKLDDFYTRDMLLNKNLTWKEEFKPLENINELTIQKQSDVSLNCVFEISYYVK